MINTRRNLIRIWLLGAVLLQAIASGAQPVTKVAGGWAHSLFLKSDGSLWAMGYNGYGQLGDGTYNNTNLPEQIVASNVTAIAAGYDFSLFLKSDGSLWAMGDQTCGELGDGTSSPDPGFPDISTNLPEEIVVSNVTAIAAGGDSSLFLKSDGSLWAMGDQSYGQLGDGTSVPDPMYQSDIVLTNLPEEIVASNVTAIAAGFFHSLFLKSDGGLWAMGYNGYGQLGDGTYGGAPYYGINLPEQIVVSGVTTIAAGAYHSLFLKSDGSLWDMGDNEFGQLGDFTSGHNLPEQIVAGTPGYNQISIQLLSGGNVSLSYMGIAGTNYELDLSFSLSPPNWVPQVTNTAGAGGVLVFTNTPNPATNNFWRVRSVP
jgi:alpha-tubulin suppressor-like RCC1 family protein